MESWANFCNRSLIYNIVHHLTGGTYENSSVIKINNENLAINGELYFINTFNAWKSLIVCDKNCATILQHFTHTHNLRRDNIDADVSEQVLEQLISESNEWSIRIQRCLLQKEKVCLYLNRADVIPNVIKIAIRCKNTFGRITASNIVFNLKYQSDVQSDLTTQRLHLMRNIAAKVLDLQGYRVSDEDCINKYIFTTKSEGFIEKGYEKYVCGVVKNIQSNTKEMYLTWEQCMKDRMDYIINNYQDMFQYCIVDKDDTEKYLLHNMAHAIMIFELLSVKPSRSVVIEPDRFRFPRFVTNTKGALFVLYNTARIEKIIADYNLKILHEDFPPLPNIDDVDFSQLHYEEEWELVYNFIFGYPQMLQNCLRCDPNFQIYPQMICLFLSRLCQKFSSYYRKVKILTRGSVYLTPKMFARLHMLRALQVVLKNALNILDIKPVSQM